MAITKVEYYNGTTLLGSRTTAPFDQFTLVDAPEGNYSLTARLYVDGVYAATSNAINVVVNAPEEWATLIVEDYEERVNVDYGIVEDAVELEYDLNLMTEAQFNSALAIYNPNGGYKSGKIYDVRDTDNTTPYDFTVTGGGGTRINAAGQVEEVIYNKLPSMPNPNLGGIATYNAGVAPDGTTTAVKWQPAVGGAGASARWLNLSGRLYSNFSTYVKALTGSTTLKMEYGATENIIINTTTGAVVSTTLLPANYTIENVGNGWFRVSMSMSTSSGNDPLMAMVGSVDTDSILLWGVQYTETADVSGANIKPVQITVTAAYPKIDYSSGEASFLFEPTRTNFLLNSETLATQSVSVTAQPHTLSFYGTGSITMSGRYVGTLTGTGANNRVSLTFPLTAGTLTLTVSGSVKFAQLEAGSSSTTPIITNGSAVTRTASYGDCKYGGEYSIDDNWAYAELELLDLSATIIQQPFGMDGDPTLGVVRAAYSVQWDGTQWLAFMKPSNTVFETINTGIATPRIKVAMCPQKGKIIINGTVFTTPNIIISNKGFSEVTIGNVRHNDTWQNARSHVRFFDIRLLSSDKTEAEMIALTTL